MLTVKDLKALLEKYPDDALVLASADEDFCFINAEDVVYQEKALIKFYLPHRVVDCCDEETMPVFDFRGNKNIYEEKNVLIIKAD
jgi:hypothetical protein